MAAVEVTELAADSFVFQIDQPPSPPTIYRVPHDLRKLNESAYTPRLVSIGPLHCNDKALKNSRVNKTKVNYCVRSLIRRAAKSDDDEAVLEREYRKKMEESVEEAKRYYEDDEAKALVDAEMLLADACFVLELLYLRHEMVSVRKIPELGIDCVRAYRTVQRDLLLLENQLPFFVLEKLFHLTKTKAGAGGSSPIGCVLSFFGDLPIMKPGGNGENIIENPCHILHLLHGYYLPAGLPKAEPRCQFLQSALDLDYAGVRFESHNARRQSQSDHNESPFQVEFEPPSSLKRWWFCSASFKIPTLHIDDSTELFLRNLIAFERCCSDVKSYVTSYAFVMDRLINTDKDVAVLQKAGIICNYLGCHKDASDLFNKLCSEVAIGDFYFAKACKEAHEYSSRSWPKAVASLKRNNFATPWGYMAFGVALVLFCSSLITAIRNLRELLK
ncbi:UPF0481 protein At3g47200-like isoform X2 [Diospyros lotus]|uniref:UPF0481 protein At3g47200-like isoform X2 n=1 Tax=Diospyros lotus TaxID=55363 RepID=UPI00224C85C0|nr:UPF0481 protein At3g47200-like isoform X2 [Diospyros lotus]